MAGLLLIYHVLITLVNPGDLYFNFTHRKEEDFIMEQITGNEGLIHVVGIIHIWAKVEGKLADILIKTKAKNL